MNNKEIASILNQIAKLLELHGENSFRARAYSQAAYKIEKLPEALDLNKIKNIPGIGNSIQEILEEILKGQKVTLLEELLDKTPKGVIDMMRIKGLGPKKLRTIWKDLKVESIGELYYACEENRLMHLKGFGKKSQDNVMKSIQFLKQQEGLFLFMDAWEIHKRLLEQIPNFSANWFLSGSVAQQENIIEKLEYIGNKDIDELKKELQSCFEQSTNFHVKEKQLLIESENLPPIVFNQVETKELGVSLIKNSSEPQWYENLNKIYSLPEEAEDEQSFWKSINLVAIPAYLRHGNLEDSIESSKNKDQIVCLDSIKGVIHSHSTYSDGLNSIKEMAIHAKSLGYSYLVVSDHSKSAFYANGLEENRILKQHAEIDELNKELAPFKIFKSIESDILMDGNLDYDSEVLSSFDLVIASVHSNLQMDKEKATERILKAIANPYTTILGHPTGRLLLSRPGYELDMEAIIAQCKKYKVAIEINAHPRRLDIDWEWIKTIQNAGVSLSINPDAHSLQGISLLEYGVKAAQRGGLLKKNNLSSFSLEEFEGYLQENKQKISRNQ